MDSDVGDAGTHTQMLRVSRLVRKDGTVIIEVPRPMAWAALVRYAVLRDTESLHGLLVEDLVLTNETCDHGMVTVDGIPVRDVTFRRCRIVDGGIDGLEFIDPVIEDCEFERSFILGDMNGLSARRTRFSDCNLSLSYSVLEDCKFEGMSITVGQGVSILRGSALDTEFHFGRDVYDLDISDTSLKRCRLTGRRTGDRSVLRQAAFCGSTIEQGELSFLTLVGPDLRNSVIASTDLFDVRFRDAGMEGTVFDPGTVEKSSFRNSRADRSADKWSPYARWLALRDWRSLLSDDPRAKGELRAAALSVLLFPLTVMRKAIYLILLTFLVIPLGLVRRLMSMIRGG